MIKLVSLDMDATTLNSNHQISPENINTLREVSQKGIEVMINTGRTFSEAKKYIHAMEFVNYAALANGSIIYDKKRDHFMRVKGMDIKQIAEAHEIVKNYKDEVALIVSGERHTYADQIYADGKGALRHRQICGDGNLRFVQNLTQEFAGHFIGKGVLIGNDQLIPQVKEELEQHFGDSIRLIYSLPSALEILDPTMDKSNALHKIMQMKKIDKKDVLSIGDGENDIGMLEASGFAVAMANGASELKKVADFVTLSNDDHGVAHALQKIILAF